MWTINGIRVFLQNEDGEKDNIVAKIQTIGSNTTIIHRFGSTSPVIGFKGLAVGNDTIQQLQNIVNSGGNVVISGDIVYSGVMTRFKYSREDKYILQTFDTSHPCDAPVYNIVIEMVEQ